MSLDPISELQYPLYPLYEKIIAYSTTSIIIILGISNFCFLCKYKNTIPFSNISPYLLLITIAGKLIFLKSKLNQKLKIALILNQILTFICYFNYNAEYFLLMNCLNIIMLHGLIWLPLIIR
jgi:hypothetical protein